MVIAAQPRIVIPAKAGIQFSTTVNARDQGEAEDQTPSPSFQRKLESIVISVPTQSPHPRTSSQIRSRAAAPNARTRITQHHDDHAHEHPHHAPPPHENPYDEGSPSHHCTEHHRITIHSTENFLN